MTDVPHPAQPRVRRWLLGCLAVAAAWTTASIGLGSEHYVSTHGDMPRYLMNGAFLYDLMRDRPFESLDMLAEYAHLYYARYPALSIGHHPVLVSVADVPSFALFGVSVFAGRLPIIIAFVAAALYLYRLITELYDEWAGAAAALVLATSPLLVELSQGVMSEPPAVALLVIAAYYLQRFCATGSGRALTALVLATGAAIWAKQLAVVALPGFLLYALARVGWRRLLARDVISACVALSLIVAPLVPLTLLMSSTNVRAAVDGSAAAAHPVENLRLVGQMAKTLTIQFTTPIAILASGGVLLTVWRRRAEAWLLMGWIAGTAALILLATRFIEVSRYSIYWVPAFAAGVGVLCARGRWQRIIVPLVLVLLVGQAYVVARRRLPGADGYEAVAKFVVSNPHGSTVLFSGDIDTGFFVFFVRKHDSARRAVVLRADKLLTTSYMGLVAVDDRITRPEEIRPRLQELGVGYVVIEDRESRSEVLEWLRAELRQTDVYTERLRLPIRTTDHRLRGTDLVVYWVNGTPAPSSEARVDLRLPAVSREIDVALSLLLNRKYFQ